MKNVSQKQQSFFSLNKSNYSYGGELRKKRSGRGSRPLSVKESHHLVFKVQKTKLRNKSFRHPKSFKYIQFLLDKYSRKFYVKIEQISYQHDHIHILARSSRRSNFHNFFRVFAGQIAQNLQVTDTPERIVRPSLKFTGDASKLRNENEDSDKSKASAKDEGSAKGKASAKGRGSRKREFRFWKSRPFSRILKGWHSYLVVRDYIQLNEKEVTGIIPYRKNRLVGLSADDWELLRG